MLCARRWVHGAKLALPEDESVRKHSTGHSLTQLPTQAMGERDGPHAIEIAQFPCWVAVCTKKRRREPVACGQTDTQSKSRLAAQESVIIYNSTPRGGPPREASLGARAHVQDQMTGTPLQTQRLTPGLLWVGL